MYDCIKQKCCPSAEGQKGSTMVVSVSVIYQIGLSYQANNG